LCEPRRRTSTKPVVIRAERSAGGAALCSDSRQQPTGTRTRTGPIIGAAAFAVIEKPVRPFSQLNVLVYGVLLIVLFVAFREGSVPMLRKTLGVSLPY
jgi:hypothetical protein